MSAVISAPRRWRRALGLVRPFQAQMGSVLLLSLLVASIAALEPLLLKWLFDELAARTSLGILLVMALLLLAIAAAREALGALANWLCWRTRLRLHHALLEKVVDRLHSLPLTYHRAEAVGSKMTRMDRGLQGLVGALGEAMTTIVPSVGYLIAAVVVMVRLEWHLAFLVLFFAPIPPFIAARAAPEQTQRERNLLDRWSRIYSRLNEVLWSIDTVKSFGREDEEKRRFLGAVREANEVVQRGVGVDSGIGALQSFVVTLARMIALVAGGVLMARGAIGMGTMMAFVGYVGAVFAPVQGLSGAYKTLRCASVSIDTIFDVLDAPDHPADAPDAFVLAEARGEVTFDGVSFAYDRGGPLVLDMIDLDVTAGERVALVGPSGGGKTTLMNLLLRFYDPLQGVVRLDGRDLRAVQQRSLRRQIGVVPQEAPLFNDTVWHNLAYGRQEATRDEIVEAASAANAHEFILRLPDGYDTVLGERGCRLSAGERQRIAIARAVLKRPRILVLDEATSALDAESEFLVQQAMNRLTCGRTTFVIAHRLSTSVGADRILVLRGGRIVESGRHGELMTRPDGYYARLVQHQIGGLVAKQAA